MNLLGLTITRQKQQALTSITNRQWWTVLRESVTGAWQRNVEIRAENVVAYSAVYACVSLIASDIGKLWLSLVEQDVNGIWKPVDNPAFSPVLRKPNRYQTRIKFVEQWIVSKLVHGNTYVLKQRDARNVVVALYVLDPTRVTVLVAADGSVYYELKRDDLSGLWRDRVVVPASEIIHDIMVALYHPLVGVSPIYASGIAAMQGIAIQTTSEKFFRGGSNPGGVLSTPASLDDETAKRMKAYWDAEFSGDKVGRVAILGDGLHFEQMSIKAADAQLIEQLRWTAETVCSTFHVPPYMIGVGDMPSYNNIEALNQQYYSQCLQTLIESFELCLDEGLALPKPYGTAFDLDDLLRMDTSTRTKAAADAIGSGAMSPNEARFKYFDLAPVVGGESPYLQQQNFSLKALAERDADKPFAKPEPAPAAPSPTDEDEEPEIEGEEMAASLASLLNRDEQLWQLTSTR
jgi:HK97 family phage portal protein